MRKNVLIGMAVAAAAALVIGVLTAGGASALSSARTIKVDARVVGETFLDAAPAGPSIGDVSVIHDQWRNAQGAAIGHDGIQCTVNEVRSNGDLEFNCLLTGHLNKNSLITAQGFFVEPAVEPPPAPPVRLAITGGTGDFTNVGGYVIFTEVSHEESLLEFHLLPL